MADKVQYFRSLHRPGKPLVLYNIWDVASAKAVEAAGAEAIATGSLAVAMAHGFADGQQAPLDFVIDNSRRIADAISLPVTIDFEGGYAADPDDIAANCTRLAKTGIVGINFEDQRIGDNAIYPIEVQKARVAAAVSSGLFVNARTDLFLQRMKAGENPDDPALLAEALERAQSYAEAGAGCFFAPGLKDVALIARLCRESPLPVNIMKLPDSAPITALADAGVARISYGPSSWRAAMKAIEDAARSVYQG